MGQGLPASAAPPTGWLPTEVMCHDMRKEVIPFPLRKAASSEAVQQTRSRIVIHVGARRYAMDLQVQTRFLRVYQPAIVGDRIDGWRVCWIGGWDKAKVLFVVMVERVVRGGASAALEHRHAGESD